LLRCWTIDLEHVQPPDRVWIAQPECFVWPIALFVSLSENIPAYGGAMALAGLVGAACGLLLGRRIDTGHGRWVVVIAYTVMTLVVLLRAASIGSPWLAVSANALGALVLPLLFPALGTATYNLAKTSPCPFRFHMATEGGWDVGCFAGCFIAAAISASGAPLSLAILLPCLESQRRQVSSYARLLHSWIARPSSRARRLHKSCVGAIRYARDRCEVCARETHISGVA
jgi:hypothetical protein